MGRAGQRRGAVDHDPAAVEQAREERRVLVVRRHHRAQPPHFAEVLGHCQRHERPAVAVRGVGDRPFLAVRQVHQARILAAPDLLRMSRVRREQRRLVHPPVPHSVEAASYLEAGDSPEVLDPQQQDGLVADPRGAGVEDRVCRIRDVVGGDDRVRRMPGEEVSSARLGHARAPGVGEDPVGEDWTGADWTPADRSRRPVAAQRNSRIVSRAVSHISVDSPP